MEYITVVVWDTQTSKIAQIKKRRKSVSWKPLQESQAYISRQKRLLRSYAKLDSCRFSFDILVYK